MHGQIDRKEQDSMHSARNLMLTRSPVFICDLIIVPRTRKAYICRSIVEHRPRRKSRCSWFGGRMPTPVSARTHWRRAFTVAIAVRALHPTCSDRLIRWISLG